MKHHRAREVEPAPAPEAVPDLVEAPVDTVVGTLAVRADFVDIADHTDLQPVPGRRSIAQRVAYLKLLHAPSGDSKEVTSAKEIRTQAIEENLRVIKALRSEAAHLKRKHPEQAGIKEAQAAQQFDEIIRLSFGQTKAVVISLIGTNRRDVVDAIISETYARAYRGIPRFRHEAKFETWLYRITYNETLRAISDEKKRANLVPLEEDDYQPKTSALSALEGSPEHAGMQAWQNGKLYAALDTLNEKERLVVILHDIEDLSYEQIMEIQTALYGKHDNESALRVRRHRSLKKLKDALNQFGIDTLEDTTLT